MIAEKDPYIKSAYDQLRLIQEKRYNDLERSASDPQFQKQLMSEYGI